MRGLPQADGRAAGYVIESSLEKGRGAVATVLVLRGTLKLGDPLLIGQEFGRVRALPEAPLPLIKRWKRSNFLQPCRAPRSAPNDHSPFISEDKSDVRGIKSG